MVFHLPAAADDKAQLRVQDAVAGAAGQSGFLEDVDALTRNLSVTDQESGGSQAGKAGAYQPSGFLIGVVRLAGTGKGFVVSIGVVHISVPPD